MLLKINLDEPLPIKAEFTIIEYKLLQLAIDSYKESRGNDLSAEFRFVLDRMAININKIKFE